MRILLALVILSAGSCTEPDHDPSAACELNGPDLCVSPDPDQACTVLTYYRVDPAVPCRHAAPVQRCFSGALSGTGAEHCYRHTASPGVVETLITAGNWPPDVEDAESFEMCDEAMRATVLGAPECE